MTGENLVSVVIPTYNHAEFLRVGVAVPSWTRHIRTGKLSLWTIIQGDHRRVLQVFDSRIRVIRIHNNGVIAASRNRGSRRQMEKCRVSRLGRYVVSGEADDVRAAWDGETGLVSPRTSRWIGARQRRCTWAAVAGDVRRP